jgi:large subunit ribosomal protein L22
MENTKQAVAKANYVRISQRKMVGICKLVRGKDVLVARSILMRTGKKGARIIEKTLDSAIANAKNKNMNWKSLFISKIVADMGPAQKRFIPWSRGSARPIKKRTTHLMIAVEERAGSKKSIKQEIDKGAIPTDKQVKEELGIAEVQIPKEEKKEVKKANKVVKTGKPKVVVKKATKSTKK